MNPDETLREKLKQMPYISPHTDREMMRRHVLAEVTRREGRPRNRRKVLLPTAFAAALAVFMFLIMSPWLSQKATDNGAELSLMRANDGDTGAEMSPTPEKSGVPATDNEESDAVDVAESETEDQDGEMRVSEEHPPPDSVRSLQENGEMNLPTVNYTGSIKKVVNIEGFRERALFDRYIFQPYGLQILIPVMNDGEKWFDGPLIDGEAAVFESRVDTIANGQMMLSSITVSVHDDRGAAEIKAEEIATEEENAKEGGYVSNPIQERVAHGERILFPRSLQDNNEGPYMYYREVFITEQNGRTFVFHIGRNELTSEGFAPRLTEVVYPELKIVQ